MICTQLDSFIEDNDRAYWVATLTDGTTVYQDDNRPGESEPSAWIRLREYCNSNNVFISGMRIVFRSNSITLPIPDCRIACFMIYSVLGIAGLTYSTGEAKTVSYMIFGTSIDGETIQTTKVMVPELLTEIDDVWEVPNTRLVSDCNGTIIWSYQKSADEK